MTSSKITVLYRREEESWGALRQRIAAGAGRLLVILSAGDCQSLGSERTQFLNACMTVKDRLTLATKDKEIGGSARMRGIRVLESTQALKHLLEGHEAKDEALRLFAPTLWAQHLRSRLQTMGLLSLPRLRIWALIIFSVGLFGFVFLQLLPSGEVLVWPRRDPITQTTNIFLAQSGAVVDLPERVKILPLVPITVHVARSITFDQISKQFTGSSATVVMTIINKSTELYSFRKTTRLTNQAGMVFRMDEPATVQPGGRTTIRATAADSDLYGETMGERGNVPAGIKWDFPGLSKEERLLVYAENKAPAKGGKTAYIRVLQKQDLDLAKRTLEEELLSVAKQLVEEQKAIIDARSDSRTLQLLYYDELQKIEYENFVLPTEFLGETVSSIPVSGEVTYTVFGYDQKQVLDMLSAELVQHVDAGKEILTQSLSTDRLVPHVFGYDDDLRWIKLTVDLTGTEQYVLNPLSPAGVRFGKEIRTKVLGLSREEAIRVIKNLPEVEKVDIRLWPPWNTHLPNIPSNIAITPK